MNALVTSSPREFDGRARGHRVSPPRRLQGPRSEGAIPDVRYLGGGGDDHILAATDGSWTRVSTGSTIASTQVPSRSTPPGHEDVRPFTRQDYETTPRDTYVVDLSTDPDELLAAFSSDAKGNATGEYETD